MGNGNEWELAAEGGGVGWVVRGRKVIFYACFFFTFSLFVCLFVFSLESGRRCTKLAQSKVSDKGDE